MRFFSAIASGFKHSFNFSDKASRSDFWFWILFCALLLAVTNTIDGMVIAPALGFLPFEEDAGRPLSLVTSLIVLLPTISCAVRRLRDTNASPYWIVSGFTVILAPILLYFLVRKGR